VEANGFDSQRAAGITAQLRTNREALFGEVGAHLHRYLTPQPMWPADPADHPPGVCARNVTIRRHGCRLNHRA
jgi:hypothetical protein